MKNSLTKEQFDILKNKGTESAFSGKLLYNKEEGIYKCVGCDNKLFTSDEKYDSGSGWPSFTSQAKEGNILFLEDNSHGMRRVEVQCSKCRSHLGHVFDDGPSPSFKRFCINSLSLSFKKS